MLANFLPDLLTSYRRHQIFHDYMGLFVGSSIRNKDAKKLLKAITKKEKRAAGGDELLP